MDKTSYFDRGLCNLGSWEGKEDDKQKTECWDKRVV